MGISQTPTTAVFPFENIAQDPSMDRYLPIPDAAAMRRRALFGLPLRSFFTGEEVSDQTIEDYIAQAISEIEHTLDLYITPVQFAERQDYSREMQFWSFGYTKLSHTPILNVNKYQLTFNKIGRAHV